MGAGARRGGIGGGDGSGRGGGGYEGGAEPAEETSVPAPRSQRNLVGVSRQGLAREVGPGRTCRVGPGRGDARPHRTRAPLHSPPLLFPGAGREQRWIGDGG